MDVIQSHRTEHQHSCEFSSSDIQYHGNAFCDLDWLRPETFMSLHIKHVDTEGQSSHKPYASENIH